MIIGVIALTPVTCTRTDIYVIVPKPGRDSEAVVFAASSNKQGRVPGGEKHTKTEKERHPSDQIMCGRPDSTFHSYYTASGAHLSGSYQPQDLSRIEGERLPRSRVCVGCHTTSNTRRPHCPFPLTPSDAPLPLFKPNTLLRILTSKTILPLVRST